MEKQTPLRISGKKKIFMWELTKVGRYCFFMIKIPTAVQTLFVSQSYILHLLIRIQRKPDN